jgi:hypothetical protein
MDAMRPRSPGIVSMPSSRRFVLFHVSDPRAALERVRWTMRLGGRIAVSVWGTSGSFPALEVWSEELDALEVPPDPAAEPPRSGELVNSLEKLVTILAAAGFRETAAETVEWTQRWDVDAFVA